MSTKPDPYKEAVETLFKTPPNKWNRYHWIMVVPLSLFVFGSCYGVLTAKPRTCDDVRKELASAERRVDSALQSNNNPAYIEAAREVVKLRREKEDVCR